MCFFFCFLREDSLPLASEPRGEPGRLRYEPEEVRERGSGRREGVLEPEVGGFLGFSDLSFSFLGVFSGVDVEEAAAAALFFSSSLRRSVSVESESLAVEYGLSVESES